MKAGVGGRLSRDLDDDSVEDDEEFRFRPDHEPTCRGNTLRLLDSGPLQVVLYVLVVLDAVVVIAEILLDLHAMRSQYIEATTNLGRVTVFLKDVYREELGGFNEDDIDHILDILAPLRSNYTPPTVQPHTESSHESLPLLRLKRELYPIASSLSNVPRTDSQSHRTAETTLHPAAVEDYVESTSTAALQKPTTSYLTTAAVKQYDSNSALEFRKSNFYFVNTDYLEAESDGDDIKTSNDSKINEKLLTSAKRDKLNTELYPSMDTDKINHIRKHIRKIPGDLNVDANRINKPGTVIDVNKPSDKQNQRSSNQLISDTSKYSSPNYVTNKNSRNEIPQLTGRIRNSQNVSANNLSTKSVKVNKSQKKRLHDISSSQFSGTVSNVKSFSNDLKYAPDLSTNQRRARASGHYSSGHDTVSPDESADNMTSRGNTTQWKPRHTYADQMLKIAHMFHYAGIGILGLFVLQVGLKMFGMGLEFCKQKLEIFDAVIVLTSFSLDLVFIEGITTSQSEEAIALLIIFLLWRILRIVNGIMVTSKKRQEFRIQLQKRARRRAQKKIEYLEDDKNWKEREITNLRQLCIERGANEEEVAHCKPRRRTIFQKMDTSVGLSSIASLSLGLSMSMTGAGRSVIKNLGSAPQSTGPQTRRLGPGAPVQHRLNTLLHFRSTPSVPSEQIKPDAVGNGGVNNHNSTMSSICEENGNTVINDDDNDNHHNFLVPDVIIHASHLSSLQSSSSSSLCVKPHGRSCAEFRRSSWGVEPPNYRSLPLILGTSDQPRVTSRARSRRKSSANHRKPCCHGNDYVMIDTGSRSSINSEIRKDQGDNNHNHQNNHDNHYDHNDYDSNHRHEHSLPDDNDLDVTTDGNERENPSRGNTSEYENNENIRFGSCDDGHFNLLISDEISVDQKQNQDTNSDSMENRMLVELPSSQSEASALAVHSKPGQIDTRQTQSIELVSYDSGNITVSEVTEAQNLLSLQSNMNTMQSDCDVVVVDKVPEDGIIISDIMGPEDPAIGYRTSVEQESSNLPRNQNLLDDLSKDEYASPIHAASMEEPTAVMKEEGICDVENVISLSSNIDERPNMPTLKSVDKSEDQFSCSCDRKFSLDMKNPLSNVEVRPTNNSVNVTDVCKSNVVSQPNNSVNNPDRIFNVSLSNNAVEISYATISNDDRSNLDLRTGLENLVTEAAVFNIKQSDIEADNLDKSSVANRPDVNIEESDSLKRSNTCEHVNTPEQEIQTSCDEGLHVNEQEMVIRNAEDDTNSVTCLLDTGPAADPPPQSALPEHPNSRLDKVNRNFLHSSSTSPLEGERQAELVRSISSLGAVDVGAITSGSDANRATILPNMVPPRSKPQHLLSHSKSVNIPEITDAGVARSRSESVTLSPNTFNRVQPSSLCLEENKPSKVAIDRTDTANQSASVKDLQPVNTTHKPNCPNQAPDNPVITSKSQSIDITYPMSARDNVPLVERRSSEATVFLESTGPPCSTHPSYVMAGATVTISTTKSIDNVIDRITRSTRSCSNIITNDPISSASRSSTMAFVPPAAGGNSGNPVPPVTSVTPVTVTNLVSNSVAHIPATSIVSNSIRHHTNPPSLPPRPTPALLLPRSLLPRGFTPNLRLQAPQGDIRQSRSADTLRLSPVSQAWSGPEERPEEKTVQTLMVKSPSENTQQQQQGQNCPASGRGRRRSLHCLHTDRVSPN